MSRAHRNRSVARPAAARVTLFGAPEGYDAAAIGTFACRTLAACLPRRWPDGAVRRRAGVFSPRDRSADLPGLGLPALRPGLAQRRNRQPADRHLDAARDRPARQADRADHGQRAGPARAAAPALRRPRPDFADRRSRRARPAAELLPQQWLHPHRYGARARRIRDPRRHRRPLSRPGRQSRCASTSLATRSNRFAASTR